MYHLFHTNSGGEGGGEDEITESSTQHRTESNDEDQSSWERVSSFTEQSSTMMHPFNIVHKSLYKFIQTAV